MVLPSVLRDDSVDMSGEVVQAESTKGGNSEEVLLASGGGNAPAAGVTFQGGVGALFAAMAMEQRLLLPKLGLGNARPLAFRFETEVPVDDTLISTIEQGYLSLQTKTTVSLSSRLDSELGKTAVQIIKQWVSCEAGAGGRDWDRPLSIDRRRKHF